MASEQLDSQAQEQANTQTIAQEHSAPLSAYQRAILQGLGVRQYALKAASAEATTNAEAEVETEPKANVNASSETVTQASPAAVQAVPSQLSQTLRDDIELAMGQSSLTFVHADEVSFSDATVATPATLTPAAKKQLWQHFCQQYCQQQ